MMKVDVYNLQGEKSSTVDLPEEIFAAKVNVDLMHQAFLRQMANARLGTHSTKRRGEVAGGGAKPWRQKGTGSLPNGSAVGVFIHPNRGIIPKQCLRRCAAQPYALH